MGAPLELLDDVIPPAPALPPESPPLPEEVGAAPPEASSPPKSEHPPTIVEHRTNPPKETARTRGADRNTGIGRRYHADAWEWDE